jgi:hypothetical protein
MERNLTAPVRVSGGSWTSLITDFAGRTFHDAMPILRLQRVRLHGVVTLGALLSVFPTVAAAQGGGISDRVSAVEADLRNLRTTVTTHTGQISNLVSGLAAETAARQQVQATVSTQTGQISNLVAALNAEIAARQQVQSALCAVYDGLSGTPPADLHCPPASS